MTSFQLTDQPVIMSGSLLWHFGANVPLPSSKKTVIIEIVCLSVFIYIRLCGVLERKLTSEPDRPGLKCLPRGSERTLAGSFSCGIVGKITGWRMSAAQRAPSQLLLRKWSLLFLFPKTRCDAERAFWFFFSVGWQDQVNSTFDELQTFLQGTTETLWHWVS